MTAFSWCPHRAERKQERSLVSPLIRALILLDQGPTLVTLFKLNYPVKTLSPNIVTLGFGASTYEFREGVYTNIKSIIPLS